MMEWLSHSPFFVLSSFSETGVDCSPRGDEPGKAFRVLDNKTVAIPDRRGNNRIETLKNILHDSRIGMVFIIPGVEEALRVKGHGSISVDQQLLDSFSIDGTPPATVILISVEYAYVQNARAIRAANLWDASSQNPSKALPSVADLYSSD